MPQLAPVNWLLLFFIFWFIMTLSVTLIWWTSKTEYKIQGIDTMENQPPSTTASKQTKPWNW